MGLVAAVGRKQSPAWAPKESSCFPWRGLDLSEDTQRRVWLTHNRATQRIQGLELQPSQERLKARTCGVEWRRLRNERMEVSSITQAVD